MKKIILIDPQGSNENSYFNGIISELSKCTYLTVVAKKSFSPINIDNINLLKFFYNTDNAKSGLLSKICKGINYLHSYIKIIKELKKTEYDVVHIQWLQMYKVDVIMLKLMKKYTHKIVLTAHNVIPHVKGEKYINDLNKIYKIVDTIILHGNNIKEDFIKIFPEYSEKVTIQYHGTYVNQITCYSDKKVDCYINEKIEKYDKILIFTGFIFYNKGVDRLIRIWLDNFSESNNLLIVAGKVRENYEELNNVEERMKSCSNILYLNKYIEPDLFSYLISKSNLIVLPYRHASMSGVVFTAAEFNKPILATKVGSIPEYIVDLEDGYLVENTDDDLLEKLKQIISSVSNEELMQVGLNLNKNIINKCSWSNIVEKLISDVY